MTAPRDLEQLVRDSLTQRAQDVEPTPALWQRVERRVHRRRRLQVAVWSLAGAAALVAAVAIVPGLVSSPDPTPEVEPMPPGPEDGVDDPDDGATDDATGDEPDDGSTEGDPTDADPAPDGGEATGDDGDEDAASTTVAEPLLVASGRRIDLIGADGRVNVLEMDAEGESWIMGLAVRPGSTADDYTAAVLTTAEGLWDLRHLHVVDGEVVTWEVFPEIQHRPTLSQEPVVGARVSGPVFSPDGAALAWIEGTWDAPDLRIIGWTSDGPGTGDRATDNTSFSLEPEGLAAGQPFVVHEWIGPTTAADAGDDELTTLTLTLEEPIAGISYLPIGRQADGAWTLPGVDVWPGGYDLGGDGATYAVGGLVGDADPEWVVRLEEDGLVLLRDPFRAEADRSERIALPDDLMPGESFPTVWVRAVGDGAVVGSANTATAYLVDGDGDFRRIDGEVAWAEPLR